METLVITIGILILIAILIVLSQNKKQSNKQKDFEMIQLGENIIKDLSNTNVLSVEYQNYLGITIDDITCGFPIVQKDEYTENGIDIYIKHNKVVGTSKNAKQAHTIKSLDYTLDICLKNFPKPNKRNIAIVSVFSHRKNKHIFHKVVTFV